MNTTAPPLRVLICDDDAMIREVLRDLLQAESGIEVVGIAGDTDEAISLAQRHAPTVAVLDVRMPGGGGVRVAREIRIRLPATRILAFSAYGDAATMAEMKRLGVTEYLLKGARNTEIVAAIRRLGQSRDGPSQPG